MIHLGNTFFVWDNYTDPYDPYFFSYFVLDDYSTDYLFFQWLRIQAGGSTAIYKDIFNSNDYD
jgi:hypothetical protein